MSNGSSSSDRQCKPCLRGTYSDEYNAVECKACAEGEESDDGATSCQSTTLQCGLGAFAETIDGDLICSECPDGTLSISLSKYWKRMQHSWLNNDRNLLLGTYSSTESATSCSKHKVCQSGSRVTAEPTSTSDRECAVCPAGQYAASLNTQKCAICAGWLRPVWCSVFLWF